MRKPLRKIALPVLIDGSSSGGVNRLARRGDGWHLSSYDVSSPGDKVARSDIETVAADTSDDERESWITLVASRANVRLLLMNESGVKNPCNAGCVTYSSTRSSTQLSKACTIGSCTDNLPG